ncbi:MAG: 50S ribosomal protein L7/L12 [Myxococcota bacterium]
MMDRGRLDQVERIAALIDSNVDDNIEQAMFLVESLGDPEIVRMLGDRDRFQWFLHSRFQDVPSQFSLNQLVELRLFQLAAQAFPDEVWPYARTEVRLRWRDGEHIQPSCEMVVNQSGRIPIAQGPLCSDLSAAMAGIDAQGWPLGPMTRRAVMAAISPRILTVPMTSADAPELRLLLMIIRDILQGPGGPWPLSMVTFPDKTWPAFVDVNRISMLSLSGSPIEVLPSSGPPSLFLELTNSAVSVPPTWVRRLGLSGQQWTDLAHHLTQVTELHLTCQEVFVPAEARLPCVEHLSLFTPTLTESAVDWLSTLPRLKRLTLGMLHISVPDDLWERLPPVERLTLKGSALAILPATLPEPRPIVEVHSLAMVPKAWLGSVQLLEGGTMVWLMDSNQRKIKAIHILREYTGLGLREAKELVESAPTFLFEARSPTEAVEACLKLLEGGAYAAVL